MLGKANLFASIRHETQVIKHLIGKVPAGQDGYRPAANQRSTLELAQYLSICGIVGTTFALTGTWDHWASFDASVKTLALKDLPQALDDQVTKIEQALAGISDQDLATKQSKMPWGAPCTFGEALLNMPIKFLTAYRMQLFMYVKACGADVGTSNCWGGVDAKKASG